MGRTPSDDRGTTTAPTGVAGVENRIDGGTEANADGLEYDVVTTPVLVVGAGAAGARVAITLAEAGVEPLVIGKRDHGDAHTTWAAGGVNAALGTLDPEDDWTIHAADTLNEGHHLNDPEAVELTAREMPDRIRELEEWGMPFDRTDDGTINQRYFGAQSYRRTCFVGDRTGEAMLETLIDRAQDLEIPYRENVMITRLLSDGRRVSGAVGFDMETGRGLLFRSDRVVVAAGGFSALYRRHSSRDDENNGDAQALALEAGARLLDTEFVQFHPTGMVGERYGEEWDGRLVTEAVRGEGGRLYNAEGERFMERYSPDQMELDARDVVARAIAREIREGRGTDNGGVYLDISHREADYVRERLPSMVERFESLADADGDVAPTTLLDDLGELLWDRAGILRDEAGLEEGLAELEALRERTADLRVEGDRTSRSFEYAVDLSVSLTVAEALLRTALERTESRGAHYRTDHPETVSDWRVNLVVSVDGGGFSIRRRGVGEPSESVQEALEEGYELDYHHLE
ncbi:L-aspartate oxidase [Natronococcus sp.]|uniref:L-aspartate oxidase n=1 Tax=Natronococcus sp. TaxID=35747 RepID=UPI003A4DC5F2